MAPMGVRTPIPVPIAIDGAMVRSETFSASVGAYVLVLSSVLPDHATELHSTYLGHPGAVTRVSHLLLAPGLAESDAVERSVESVPVMVARRRCLYDHLQRLQDCLERLGHPGAEIPVEDAALHAVEM